MSQAETTNTTRRVVLAGLASVPALPASTALASAVAAQPDAEVTLAGEKFQALLRRYVPGWVEWAGLSREAHAVTEAKFGNDYSAPAWTFRGPGEARAYLHEAHALNGTDRASDAQTALYKEMEPLSELIRDTEIQSIAGLRAKTLVAIWQTIPTSTSHDGCLEINDPDLYSLLVASIAVTGLSDFFGWVVEQIEGDATKPISGFDDPTRSQWA